MKFIRKRKQTIGEKAHLQNYQLLSYFFKPDLIAKRMYMIIPRFTNSPISKSDVVAYLEATQSNAMPNPIIAQIVRLCFILFSCAERKVAVSTSDGMIKVSRSKVLCALKNSDVSLQKNDKVTSVFQDHVYLYKLIRQVTTQETPPTREAFLRLRTMQLGIGVVENSASSAGSIYQQMKLIAQDSAQGDAQRLCSEFAKKNR